MLSKTAYNEMLKIFENMSPLFKKHMFKYTDSVLAFLEFELDKIPYFRMLSASTKQLIIFSMELETFEKGSFICERD